MFFKFSSCGSRGFRGSHALQCGNERPPSETTPFQHSDTAHETVASLKCGANLLNSAHFLALTQAKRYSSGVGLLVQMGFCVTICLKPSLLDRSVSARPLRIRCELTACQLGLCEDKWIWKCFWQSLLHYYVKRVHVRIPTENPHPEQNKYTPSSNRQSPEKQTFLRVAFSNAQSVRTSDILPFSTLEALVQI